MFCFASLIVLGILSIFSAKYRGLAREALDCVFRRVTLRPCTTGFDVKVKSTILSKLLQKSPKAAKFISQRFDVIAVVFVALFFGSLIWSVRGVYNYWAYGNCNGLNQSGFCAFDPTGKNNAVSGLGADCRVGGGDTGNLTLKQVDLSSFFVEPGSNKQLVFMGCYACEYSKATYPLVKQLIETYHPTVQWVFYPAHPESEYLMTYDYCVQKQAPDRYTTWLDQLYREPIPTVASESAALQLIEGLGLNKQSVLSCVNDLATKEIVMKRKYEIDKTGIYGTPTVFLNGTPVVGPKPYRVYRRLLTGSWF